MREEESHESFAKVNLLIVLFHGILEKIWMVIFNMEKIDESVDSVVTSTVEACQVTTWRAENSVGSPMSAPLHSVTLFEILKN